MPGLLHIRRRLPVTAFALVALRIVACGSSDDSGGAAESPRFKESSQTFAITDFEGVGFKKNKSYDVEGLEGAQEVWLGFWGLSASERTDYELRFYPTHQDAIAVGAPIADEATGDLFRERKESQTWTVGAKDRWRASSATGITTRDTGASVGPIYADFVVFGNVIILCEGSSSDQSFERCDHLIDALTADA